MGGEEKRRKEKVNGRRREERGKQELGKGKGAVQQQMTLHAGEFWVVA